MLTVISSRPPLPAFVDAQDPPRPTRTDTALGAVSFGTAPGGVRLTGDVATLDVPAGGLGDRFREVWTTAGEVVSGWCGRLVYGADGGYLFCAGWLPGRDQYRDAVRALYGEIFSAIRVLGYPHLYRIWNLLGGINDTNSAGLEIYRDFCQGRSEAFEQHGLSTRLMPAATGIGSNAPGLAVYLLASRAGEVRQVENPRQVPAYRYPPRYGPRSPSFARATHLATESGEQVLMIAGTASVVGHATRHPHDLRRQCEETFANLRHLLAPENLTRHGLDRGHGLKDIDQLKVYVRHERDLPLVRDLCRREFGPLAGLRFLVVDICRSDLLVEIEGVVVMAPSGRGE